MIGDTICDRGRNDFFTFCLINHLKKEGVDISILFSNHDAEFIKMYERKHHEQEELSSLIDNNIHDGIQDSSSCNLADAIRAGLILVHDLCRMVERYLDCLKAIDYALTDTGIVISSHALIGIEEIKVLAKDLMLTIKMRQSRI